MARLIRLSEVEARTGLKKSAIYERARLGTFPRPIKLGRSTRWIEAETQGWIEAQIRASREAAP